MSESPEIKTNGLETSGLVAIGVGLAVPAEIRYWATCSEAEGFNVRVTIRYDTVLERYILKAMALESFREGLEVTGAIVRAVPFHKYFLVATSLVKAYDLETRKYSEVPGLEMKPDLEVGVKLSGRSRETLKLAAKYFRLVEVLNHNSVQHVQALLGAPYPTVISWLKVARQIGILDNPESLKLEQSELFFQQPNEVDIADALRSSQE